MYSDMSMRIIASSASNMNSASARASSVLPTPVGPRNRNEPIGRSGSCRPGARAAQRRRDRLDRLVLADRRARAGAPPCGSASRPRPRAGALTGMPVQRATTSAMSSASTSSLRKTRARRASPSPRRLALGELLLELGDLAVAQLGGALRGRRRARRARPRARASSSRSLISRDRLRSRPSRSATAPSSPPSARAARRARARSPRGARAEASSVSLASEVSSISSCITRRSTSSISVGSESISMRRREAASSIRSIALSGRKRSAM